MLLLSTLALGNGLTSHQWITLQAVEELPDGDLHDLLSREDIRPYLLNGALFPDGGYAVGDDYGEMAHWEPFQTHFLDWIRESGGDEHKAFLFGLCSHGMADQTFDSMFMERSRVYDADYGWAWGDSMDEATDVALAAAMGPGEVPELWFPEEFPTLYAELGYAVEADTLEQGTQLAGLAIAAVGAFAEYPETVEAYNAKFPWANAHIVDAETRCSPLCEAKIVAAYWQAIWDRLEGGDGWDLPVIATVPADGDDSQPLEAGSPESTVAVVFARGLNPESVTANLITVADSDDEEALVDLRVFYGSASHVVLIAPTQGWEPETDYTVTVHPGIVTFDGPTLETEFSFGFSTRIPEEPEAIPLPLEACGCGATSGGAGVWLLAFGLVFSRERATGTRHRRETPLKPQPRSTPAPSAAIPAA